MRLPLLSHSSLILVAALACTPAALADVVKYVKQPDSSFSWKLQGKTESDAGTVYDIHLVSQVWHGITWTHQLQVYQPKGVKPRSTMLMYNTGGTANAENIGLGLELAAKTRSPVAILYNIPNQPLFGGKTEDGLIAETFVRYLDSKDASWPLLFPMVKSVVKAMDALQAFSKEEWKVPIEDFIISGASKRGWTTWLTGASDPRVKAIVPLVIDTLNMVKQMENQKRAFGAYSEQIADYTERGLVPIPDTELAKGLWKMVDPYFYRERITQPKLLILGNNDPYWTVDALNLYWDGLKGDKYITYVPNAGHDLSQVGKNGKGDQSRAVTALEAFARLSIDGKPLPKITWKNDESGGKYRITATTDVVPSGVRVWYAAAPTKDFRKSQWLSKPATIDGHTIQGAVEAQPGAYGAFYLDMDFDAGELPYHLCTQIRVISPANKRE